MLPGLKDVNYMHFPRNLPLMSVRQYPENGACPILKPSAAGQNMYLHDHNPHVLQSKTNDTHAINEINLKYMPHIYMKYVTHFECIKICSYLTILILIFT